MVNILPETFWSTNLSYPHSCDFTPSPLRLAGDGMKWDAVKDFQLICSKTRDLVSYNFVISG